MLHQGILIPAAMSDAVQDGNKTRFHAVCFRAARDIDTRGRLARLNMFRARLLFLPRGCRLQLLGGQNAQSRSL